MRRRKVSPRTRDQLIQIYLHMGSDVSAASCLEHGVNSKYAASEASSMGLSRPIWRAGNRYKNNHVEYSTRSQNDPRWELAIERGAVVAA
jgi:hypothetical protein